VIWIGAADLFFTRVARGRFDAVAALDMFRIMAFASTPSSSPAISTCCPLCAAVSVLLLLFYSQVDNWSEVSAVYKRKEEKRKEKKYSEKEKISWITLVCDYNRLADARF
jgi:hypothetical protein